MAVNKCEVGGKVLYTDTPCPEGKGKALSISSAPATGKPANSSQMDAMKMRLQAIELERKAGEKSERALPSVNNEAQAREQRHRINAEKCAREKPALENNKKLLKDPHYSFTPDSRKQLEANVKEYDFYCN